MMGVLAGMWLTPTVQAGPSGKIGYMSGTLVAQKADGTIKVLAPKSEVQEGDTLVTGQGSYAQVLMNDGSKMTLRPNSNLKIVSFKFNKDDPKQDNMALRLLKGGFRTVTGLIGKRGNPDAYSLRAAGATIGIRGTDFTSRLCAAQNCAEDDGQAAPPKPVAAGPRPVGRVMLIRGELAAKDMSGKLRKLVLGAPVFEGDTLQTAAATYAVVAFRDGGRITLQENSVFQVEAFKYDKASNVENAALRLLKGGVRVVTGLIGRVNHDNYQFRMSGATIGIRGTGFDAWCNGPCAEGVADFGATPDKPLEGAGVFVWAGEVVLVSPGGSLTVAINQAAIIARETGKPIQIQAIPPAIKDNAAPKPDSVPGDVDKLFEESQSDGSPGLYVTVHDGQIILSKGDTKIDLGKGETGFTNEQIITRLAATPAFLGGDSKLENIEKNVPKSNLNQNGCMVGP
ncbi:MAG: hypothetical protein OHK0054_10430 [Sideroxydans sp.]